MLYFFNQENKVFIDIATGLSPGAYHLSEACGSELDAAIVSRFLNEIYHRQLRKAVRAAYKVGYAHATKKRKYNPDAAEAWLSTPKY